MKYYSLSTKGFYQDDLHTKEGIPEDAKQVSDQDYIKLYNGVSKGMVIKEDVSGALILSPPPALNDEQLAANKKFQRSKSVDKIVVEVPVIDSSGQSVLKPFDGNERSQDRMSRRIQAMQIEKAKSTQWILADGTTAEVTLGVLESALSKASLAQSAIWTSEAAPQ